MDKAAQRQKVIELLRQAQEISRGLRDDATGYLIEIAIESAKGDLKK